MIHTEAYHLYSDTDITRSNDLSRLTVLEIAQAEEKTADFQLWAAVAAAADPDVVLKYHNFDNLANHSVSLHEQAENELVSQETESWH